jgi:predicted nucleotidyltransferase
VIPELKTLEDLLPAEGDVWLCVIYGSAARGGLGPNSDIDVLGEGNGEALEAWREQAEDALKREINVSGVTYMLKQPMMVAEILDEPVVLRDVRGRLKDMCRQTEEEGRLPLFLLRIMREAFDDFTVDPPERGLTRPERLFMEALAGARNERKKMTTSDSPLQRQWATERLTRRLRNMLRDWPEHGNYVEFRRAIENLDGTLQPDTLAALRVLPYEHASLHPVDPAIDPAWTEAHDLLLPVLDDLIDTAAANLGASLARQS